MSFYTDLTDDLYAKEILGVAGTVQGGLFGAVKTDQAGNRLLISLFITGFHLTQA